jgi:hypothetical protein
VPIIRNVSLAAEACQPVPCALEEASAAAQSMKEQARNLAEAVAVFRLSAAATMLEGGFDFQRRSEFPSHA